MVYSIKSMPYQAIWLWNENNLIILLKWFNWVQSHRIGIMLMLSWICWMINIDPQ